MKIGIFPVGMEIRERDPESVYAALRGKNTYLLESSEGGEKVARYSFIGFNPALRITLRGGKSDLDIYDSDLLSLTLDGENPMDIMRNLLLQFREIHTTAPRFFGGFVGYFSYDTIRYFVDIGESTRDDLRHPDCEFVLTKNNIIFDHKLKKTYLLSHQFNDGVDKKAVMKKLQEIKDTLSRNERSNNGDVKPNGKELCAPESNMTREEFEAGVRDIRRYIRAGDIFQAVLSQRFESSFRGDEFSIYKRLKAINPSSYMYFLDFGDRKIVGSSPEMLVRVENKGVETYPIAGTRPRGKTPEEDKILEKELMNDEKERAEHIMLVDLGRNDIGRVAEFGSVRVTRFMGIEKYSHVQHIVSEITGNLRKEEDEFSALRSVFPAGTVSGAPKVRAMEIIEELEPTRRGIYSGCVGYFSFNRNMDTAITIRTIDFEKGRAFIQVGAGIVADSKPEREYEETINKGKAMLKALEVGDEGPYY